MLGHNTKIILCLLFLTAVSFKGIAQGFNPGFEKKHDYPIRAFFNKFSINLSTGYGRTFYRHTLNSHSYLRNETGSYIIPGGSLPSGVAEGYSNWFSVVVPATIPIGDSPDSEINGYKFLSADSAAIDMKGGGYNIPLNLSVYYNLFRFRIGGGIGMNLHGANPPQPDNFLSRFPEPERTTSLMTHYYILLGYSVYEYYDNAFGVDIRFGNRNMGSGFDKNTVDAGGFVNVGVTLEKVISEYFRVYLRPAYEFKSFNVSLPTENLAYKDNAVMLTLGVSINYPGLPRSPIKADKIQMKHRITDPQGNQREFRGQPIWRKQDPKIGEIYPELMKNRQKRKTQRKNFFKKKK